MRAIKLLLAFIAGALLYQVGVVLIGGVLNAVTIPKAYFDWFGRDRAEVALAVLQFVGFAVPIAVVVAGGTLCIQRALSSNTRPVLLAVFAGLLASFAYGVAEGLVSVSALPAQASPPLVLFQQLLLPPWWAASGALAPWVGFGFAAWLVLRHASGQATTTRATDSNASN